MTRRLILHVGSPKCGSTFLQQVLLRNQAQLLAQLRLYLHVWKRRRGKLQLQFCMNYLCNMVPLYRVLISAQKITSVQGNPVSISSCWYSFVSINWQGSN